MGKRLDELVTEHLGLSWVDFAHLLGYKNSSTLHKVKVGVASMSAEKLHEIAKLELTKGKVNLNWLVTGDGCPFLGASVKSEIDNMKNATEDFQYDENALVLALMNILQRSSQLTDQE